LKAGAEQSIEVQPSYGLGDAEIERMLEESIEHAEQDFTERQLIEARNEAEITLTATQKSLAREQAQQLSAAERGAIDGAVAALREAMAGRDYKLIRAQLETLNAATERLAELQMNRALAEALEGKRLGQV
jgi:molecular chaperone DnaK (HSP70)